VFLRLTFSSNLLIYANAGRPLVLTETRAHGYFVYLDNSLISNDAECSKELEPDYIQVTYIIDNVMVNLWDFCSNKGEIIGSSSLCCVQCSHRFAGGPRSLQVVAMGHKHRVTTTDQYRHSTVTC